MEKGQTVRIKIEDVADNGSGIGRYDGMTVFAKGAVFGDVCDVKVDKVKKRYAVGETDRIVELSPYRIKSDCPYFEQGCGGCDFRNITYEAETELKAKQVKDKLTRIAGIADPGFEGIIKMTSNSRYRNKAQIPVSTGGIVTEKGGVIRPASYPRAGFYKKGTHEVVDADDCLIQSRAASAAAVALKRFMEEDHITGFDERWNKGLIRRMIVKTSESTGEVMIILVINGKGIPDLEKLAGMLDDAVYEAGYSLESIAVDTERGENGGRNVADHEIKAGRHVIYSKCMGLDFEISPSAFYQVNSVQAEKLYGKAMEYADLKGGEIVYDLYCGVGTIGLIAADNLKRAGSGGYVYGVESVKGAVIDANRNAVINRIVNAEFVCGLAEEKTEELLAEKGRPDIVFIDPPRSGCDEKMTDLLKRILPEKIIYVSCDPATMARDIKRLSGSYRLEKSVAVDMFPRCNNIETVGKLVKI